MTPDQIKVIVDEIFTELEAATAGRPLIYLSVMLVHKLIDAALVSKVAAKVATLEEKG
jgi:hypothetical protein